MSAHTPGPWSVGYTRPMNVHASLKHMVEVPIHVGEGGGRGNALALVSLGGPGATSLHREDIEANARLIAAAPEMYGALCAVLQCKEATSWPVVKQVAAALDKARGIAVRT